MFVRVCVCGFNLACPLCGCVLPLFSDEVNALHAFFSPFLSLSLSTFGLGWLYFVPFPPLPRYVILAFRVLPCGMPTISYLSSRLFCLSAHSYPSTKLSLEPSMEYGKNTTLAAANTIFRSSRTFNMWGDSTSTRRTAMATLRSMGNTGVQAVVTTISSRIYSRERKNVCTGWVNLSFSGVFGALTTIPHLSWLGAPKGEGVEIVMSSRGPVMRSDHRLDHSKAVTPEHVFRVLASRPQT